MALIGHTHLLLLLFLFFTMALMGHAHLFPFFSLIYFFFVNEKIIKRNKKDKNTKIKNKDN